MKTAASIVAGPPANWNNLSGNPIRATSRDNLAWLKEHPTVRQ